MLDPVQWQRILLKRDNFEGCEAFPLELTAIERYFVLDHSTSYPKRCQVVVEFDGAVEFELYIEALKQTIRRHPMMVAKLDAKKRRWHLEDEPSFQIAYFDWQDREIDGTNNAARVVEQVTQPTPDCATLRVGVAQQSNCVSFAFDVNHAACDGLGLRNFVVDAADCYNTLLHQREGNRWRRLDPQRLKHRHECPVPKAQDEVRATTLREKLIHAYHFHFRGPAPLKPLKRRKLENIYKLQFRSYEVNLMTSMSLREYFIEHSIGVNEWASACLLEVMTDWQQRVTSDLKRTRIMMPIDLRSWDDLRLPACNKIGFAFIVRDQRKRSTFNELIEDCRYQLGLIRTLCLGADFVKLFEPFKNAGALISFVLRRSTCLSTAVLTNLGDVTGRQRKGRNENSRSTSGDLSLRGVYGWPPIRFGTQVGIGICRFDQRLSITSVIDGEAFTKEEADEFFSLFIRRFESPVGIAKRANNELALESSSKTGSDS